MINKLNFTPKKLLTGAEDHQNATFFFKKNFIIICFAFIVNNHQILNRTMHSLF